MSAVMRIKELNRTRSRRAKLRKLRDRYAVSKSEQEKDNILQRVQKIAVWLSVEEFLAPLEKNK